MKKSIFLKTKINKTPSGKEIEEEFYAHYKKLRQEIWQDLIKLNTNPKFSKNFYLYKAQKLIDRIIFIRFCHENGALNNDAVLEALNNKFVAGKYNRLKLLFSAMNLGNPEIGIAKFNGGLFAPDFEIDELEVSDLIIDKIKTLYDYNFGSDLNINILGHIFEQSISDLENLTNSNQKKRKKDGIFYTPAFVTKYIVESAVGGWLDDQKVQIKTQIKAKENTAEFWQKYANKLATIKVLDPACGSGAFLVEVFDFLQKQWKQVSRHIKTNFSYLDILTKNIFGVDLNPNSVGITKLSLWLKTAHYRQPLCALDENIKIGNSLIDDEKVAGFYHEFEGAFVQENVDAQGGLFAAENFFKNSQEIDAKFKKPLAFEWQNQFPQIITSHELDSKTGKKEYGGGFDVIVGNPPYVFARGNNFSKEEKDFYCKNYPKLTAYQLNTYLLFIEKSNELLQTNGRLGFIIPNNWLTINSFINLRKFVLEKTSKTKIINAFGDAFENASVDSCILTFVKKTPNQDDEIIELGEINGGKIKTMFAKKNEIALGEEKIINIAQANNIKALRLIEKINQKSICLEKVAKILSGIKSYEVGKGNPKQTEKIKKERIYHSTSLKNDSQKKYLEGCNVARYYLGWSGEFIDYGSWLAAPRKEAKFLGSRILVRQIPSKLPYAINAVFTEGEFVNDINSMIIQEIKPNPLFVLAVLNSRLISFWFDVSFNKSSRTIFPQFKVGELAGFPIPKVSSNEQNILVEKAQKMLDLNQDFHQKKGEFLDYFCQKFSIKKATKNLQNWRQLSFNEFVQEISKQKIALKSDVEFEFKKLFEEQKLICQNLKNQIAKTDGEIDVLVYQIYGLKACEIEIIEGKKSD